MNLQKFGLLLIALLFGNTLFAKMPPFSNEEVQALEKIAREKNSHAVSAFNGITLRIRSNLLIPKNIDHQEIMNAADEIPGEDGKPCKVYALISFYEGRKNRDSDIRIYKGTRFVVFFENPHLELSGETDSRGDDKVPAGIGNVKTTLYFEQTSDDGSYATPEIKCISAYSCRKLTAFELLVFTQCLFGPITVN